MAIITPQRLENRRYTDNILYRAIPKSNGDVSYFIYPPAGVTRFGVGRATVQINKGSATSIQLMWGVFDVEDLERYLKNPSVLPEPKFINLGSAHTADAIVQVEPPYSAIKAVFTGTVSTDTWVTIGIS